MTSGRPRYRPDTGEFVTRGGVVVSRTVERVTLENVDGEFEALVTQLNTTRGAVFQSAYEFPGRYSRWSVGFKNPPVVLESRGQTFTISALNQKGMVMLPWIQTTLQTCTAVQTLDKAKNTITGKVKPIQGRFPEEERSKQNSVFSVIRALTQMFATDTETDPQLGLYGAFGYDLTFQFEPIKQTQTRSETDGERDLVLYLPDEILVHDVPAGRAWKLSYEFSLHGQTTRGISTGVATIDPNNGYGHNPTAVTPRNAKRDDAKGDYAKSVERAKEEFKCGNLFECVLSHTFREPCPDAPSDIYFRLVQNNPSPYLFIINLGRREHLVGASPEMFVRVERNSQGLRCETCPISGTIRRGRDALQDADRVFEILDSDKDKSELTMCTDVDRNDKSRVCRSGSVKVVGRRQIESYSKLIHTVDHVEGYLRDGFDALDAFLVHTWAVTVSGAPKAWAIQFIEQQEKSARAWYGGAVGIIGFDGHLNTGLTIRTVRLIEGVAEVRAGATLLWDSIPEEEEKETELKASALIEAVTAKSTSGAATATPGTSLQQQQQQQQQGQGKRVLLVDHEDSFVHTLANYLRQTGATVTTVRSKTFTDADLVPKPDLVVLSPGPGRPTDFACNKTLDKLIKNNIPVFGVCLGLQAMIEYFGGKLGVLDYPMHGKPSVVRLVGKDVMFDGLPESFTVARYHSLYALSMPADGNLIITAVTKAKGGEQGHELVDDVDIVMAIRHKSLPVAAVQFHPESILTDRENGLRILGNAFKCLGV